MGSLPWPRWTSARSGPHKFDGVVRHSDYQGYGAQVDFHNRGAAKWASVSYMGGCPALWACTRPSFAAADVCGVVGAGATLSGSCQSAPEAMADLDAAR